MSAQVKSIKLSSEIGTWYEYKPESRVQDILFENISKDVMNDLLHMHYKFVTKVAAAISEDLKISFDIFSVKIEQMKYRHLNSSIRGNSVSTCVDIGDNIDLMLIWDYKFAVSMIDKVAGGVGELLDYGEEFSTIENIIFTTIVKRFLVNYEKFWRNIFKIPKEIIIDSPALKNNSKIKKDENIIVFDYVISVGEQEKTSLKIVFPSVSLDAIFEKYRAKDKNVKKKATVKLSPESVDNVKVPVDVEIGKTTVTMRDIINLEKEDVIVLNNNLGDNVGLKIGDDAELIGSLGKKGRKLAVKIYDVKTKYVDMSDVVEDAGTKETEGSIEEAEETETVQEEQDLETDAVAGGEDEDMDEDFDHAESSAEEASAGDTAEGSSDSLLDEFDDADEEEDEFTWDLDDL